MMTPIRLTVTAVTACAAGLSLAACSAGITTASPAPSSRPPSASRTAPALGAAASSTARPQSLSPSPSASPVDTVNIDSPIRTFPVPSGAQVISNVTCDKETIIELGAVTVPQVSGFYNSVLPKDGYKITGNTLISTSGNGGSGPAAEIEFTGHGYKGTIAAVSNLGSEMASAGVSTAGLPTNMTGNLITIDLIAPGAGGCPTTAP
jgi:hypothetical protein